MNYVIQHDVVGPFHKGQVVGKAELEKAMNCSVAKLIGIGTGAVSEVDALVEDGGEAVAADTTPTEAAPKK